MRKWTIVTVLGTLLALTLIRTADADQRLGATQLVEIAIEANPQIRAARERWTAAMHQIKPALAPADPVFGYANVDSPTNMFSEASVHTLTATQSLQFPGKAILQARSAERTANIARLAYEAMVRDVRAQAETAYYQLLLDGALAGVQHDLSADLARVLKVTEVAYEANSVTQTDFISSEFDLAASRQTERESRVSAANDRTTLNQIMFRRPDEPLPLDERINLTPISENVDALVALATNARQEILEAAMAEQNSKTALKLAKLEYAPDYSVGFTFDNYLLASAAPSPNRLQDYGFSISFNLPVFFWIKQNEDIARAHADLEAARYDLESIRSQTAAQVINLYRTAQIAYSAALLYRNSLIPLARQDFGVALIAYQSRKIDFVALSGSLRITYESRVAYLQAVNRFMATRAALEQATGSPLPQ
jgi:outer membrane protein, heavy metal efflux system